MKQHALNSEMIRDDHFPLRNFSCPFGQTDLYKLFARTLISLARVNRATL